MTHDAITRAGWLAAICFLLLSGFGFKSSKPRHPHPPGTKQINDTLYADETEISNFSWQEYRLWMKTKYGEQSDEYRNTAPDTTVWLRDGMTSNEPYTSLYHRFPGFRDYPVVGISYEQAQAFCAWRSDVVNRSTLMNGTKLTVSYRLPSRQEWELLAGAAFEVFNGPNEKIVEVENKNKITCRLNQTARVLIRDTLPVGFTTAEVRSYSPNGFGLYNLVGNVAEMVLEKGVCKGGSWNHVLDDCRTGKDLVYTRPEAWLGFRCVCVVTK